jgi:GNAT superfamily N-acetyltransferase
MSLQPSSASEASAIAPSSKSTSGLPQLSTYTTSSETERLAALKLVADSVAQQRQVAAKSLITHPINLAAYVLVVAIATRYLYTSPDDLFLLCMTLAGVTMVALAGVRMAVGGYLSAAEGIDWEWLGEDKMIVVKWGEEVIGALVLGWADNSEGAKRRGTRRRRGKAVVRAWTIRLKYRGKGVGEGLLEEAVKVAGNMGADGIVFDGEHASEFSAMPFIMEMILTVMADSKRVLPGVYNGFLNKQEARAEKKLEKVADEKGNFRQRRSSPTWGSR